ncbi:MAG: hypothetical protein ABI834_00620 [Ginsengibacter sp.]
MRSPVLAKRLSVFLFMIFCLSSCRVMLVPEYNAQLDEQISNTAKATDKLYIDMLDTPKNNRAYDTYKERYNQIESEVYSIQLKNEGRPKNGDFIVIIKNLKDAFDEAKKYHKDHTTLSDGEAIAYRATLSGFWKPLYLAERGLMKAK